MSDEQTEATERTKDDDCGRSRLRRIKSNDMAKRAEKFCVEDEYWDGHSHDERNEQIELMRDMHYFGWMADFAVAISAKTVRQLVSTQSALKNLHDAVIKSRSVNDPLGMASAMEEAGKWF